MRSRLLNIFFVTKPPISTICPQEVCCYNPFFHPAYEIHIKLSHIKSGMFSLFRSIISP